MQTYRLAIVGLGRMGSTIDEEVVGYPAVARPFSVAASCGNVNDGLEPSRKGTDRFDLVAGADLIAEKRVAFADRWGVPAVYEDFGRMIDEHAPILVRYVQKQKTTPNLPLPSPNPV